MIKILPFLLCLVSACGVDDEHEPQPIAVDDEPTCGRLADPALSTFDGCRPETIGQLARVGDSAYRCTEDGFVYVDSRCRFFGEDLRCGCGVDDGEG